MKIYGYGLFTAFWILFCFIFTKIFFRTAKIIRLPIFIRNYGSFEFGKSFTTGVFNRIDVFKKGTLVIGDRVQINDNCHIACAQRIVIGDDVLIASRVFISDHDHKIGPLNSNLAGTGLETSSISIGDFSWLGENVVVLKGVEIGRNVIVGANAVVTSSVPDNAIVAGVPAKVIRYRT